MIAHIRLYNVPAWTEGYKWHSTEGAISEILECGASAQIVATNTSQYIPDMAVAMATYAQVHIPDVSIVSFEETVDDREDINPDGSLIIY